jgi:hypothetical protein
LGAKLMMLGVVGVRIDDVVAKVWKVVARV